MYQAERFRISNDHMYPPERFRISIPDAVPSYVYVGPYESSVSYQYPHQIVVTRDDRSHGSQSETTAIRRELREIKNDIGEIKRRQASPTYHVVQQEYPNYECPVCNSTSYNNQHKKSSQVPMYYCETCHSFVDQPTYSIAPTIRPKTAITTYQDSYRPPPYSSHHGHLDRRITLNELQREHQLSSAPVHHPRHWIPAASKNSYPHRRWNLSVPHSEP